jgi:DNA-binding MarR family transcriptional regulator
MRESARIMQTLAAEEIALLVVDGHLPAGLTGDQKRAYREWIAAYLDEWIPQGIDERTPIMEPITPKQMNVVRAIRSYRARYGYGPSLRDIGADLGLSVVTIHQHVQILIARRILQRTPGRHRSIEIAGEVVSDIDRATVHAAAKELQEMSKPTRERVLAVSATLLEALTSREGVAA